MQSARTMRGAASMRDVRAASMKERVAQLPPVPASVRRIRIPAADNWTIENVDGSRISFAIFNHLATTNSNRLNRQAAETGLYLYDEVVADAIARPGAHKNIDLLLQVRDTNADMELVVESE